MSLPVHSVFPARLQQQFNLNLQAFRSAESLRRLWNKDLSLWPSTNGRPLSAHSLDWLDLPQNIEPLLERLAAYFAPAALQGLRHIVLIAMSASSFAAELVVASLNLGLAGFDIRLLDNVDPAYLRDVEAKIDLSRTLFLFAPKQSSSLRASLLLLYFLKRYKDAGIPDAGRHFVAFAEENSYVAQLARQYAFRQVFIDSPGFSGQFSSVVHYSVLLSTLGASAPSTLASATRTTAESCSPSVDTPQNPALTLAALLSAVAQSAGRLLFFSSPNFAPLADRLGYVAGAATCKNGKGLVAASTREPFSAVSLSPADLSVILRVSRNGATALDKHSARCRHSGLPALEIDLPGFSAVPSEVFCWEVASCLAASSIGANPFDDSDLLQIRSLVHSQLNIVAGSSLPPRTFPRLSDSFVELHFEGPTRRELSTLSVEAALRSLFSLISPGGYLALLSFLPHSEELDKRVLTFCDKLQEVLGVPVLWSFGSRFVHRLAHTILSGPATGVALLLTAEHPCDIAVPGAPYSFGALRNAFAMAAFSAVCQRGHHIVRVHFRSSVNETFDLVAAEVLQAGRKIHKAAASSLTFSVAGPE